MAVSATTTDPVSALERFLEESSESEHYAEVVQDLYHSITHNHIQTGSPFSLRNQFQTVYDKHIDEESKVDINTLNEYLTNDKNVHKRQFQVKQLEAFLNDEAPKLLRKVTKSNKITIVIRLTHSKIRLDGESIASYRHTPYHLRVVVMVIFCDHYAVSFGTDCNGPPLGDSDRLLRNLIPNHLRLGKNAIILSFNKHGTFLPMTSKDESADMNPHYVITNNDKSVNKGKDIETRGCAPITIMAEATLIKWALTHKDQVIELGSKLEELFANRPPDRKRPTRLLSKTKFFTDSRCKLKLKEQIHVPLMEMVGQLLHSTMDVLFEQTQQPQEFALQTLDEMEKMAILNDLQRDQASKKKHKKGDRKYAKLWSDWVFQKKLMEHDGNRFQVISYTVPDPEINDWLNHKGQWADNDDIDSANRDTTTTNINNDICSDVDSESDDDSNTHFLGPPRRVTVLSADPRATKQIHAGKGDPVRGRNKKRKLMKTMECSPSKKRKIA